MYNKLKFTLSLIYGILSSIKMIIKKEEIK